MFSIWSCIMEVGAAWILLVKLNVNKESKQKLRIWKFFIETPFLKIEKMVNIQIYFIFFCVDHFTKLVKKSHFITLLDLFRNSICSLKRLFSASLTFNFSAISLDMLSKLPDKSAQKYPVFPSKANFERGLFQNDFRVMGALFNHLKSWNASIF